MKKQEYVLFNNYDFSENYDYAREWLFTTRQDDFEWETPNDIPETMILDEIDTGISGKTSQSVAEEVKELSKYMQIIMITHQAIIASKSDRHFYVRKTQDDKTSVNIYVLEGENKQKAIAELASGKITEESMQLAATLRR